ncbi:hypothetical protein CLV52_0274 [Amnibacterium kyonggiense]|uniref:DUF3040 family protein n=2 Tax=Amnibacterium kyonggiense TaxID=595671 RepID=A0A4R7FPP8_9MICO|nr:hypothetical protein CLV52_0274 [Amnibacterium kyonggiense]
MTPEEAQRIRAQDAAGRLDHADPEVRRVIEDANRTSVRAHVYGRDAAARGTIRWSLLVTIAATAVFIVGLALHFLLPPM